MMNNLGPEANRILDAGFSLIIQLTVGLSLGGFAIWLLLKTAGIKKPGELVTNAIAEAISFPGKVIDLLFGDGKD